MALCIFLCKAAPLENDNFDGLVDSDLDTAASRHYGGFRGGYPAYGRGYGGYGGYRGGYGGYGRYGGYSNYGGYYGWKKDKYVFAI